MNKKIFLMGFSVFFLIGCAVKHPRAEEKFFPGENDYMIKALVFENDGNYEQSINLYRFLYEKTKNPVFYEKIIEDLYRSKKYAQTVKAAKRFLSKKFDKKILEYEVFALIRLKKYDEAKKLLLSKLNTKNTFFYSLMSYIYLIEGKYDQAVYYMKSLYALNPNKQTLLRLADLLIKLHKYNEALAYLRTHLSLYGCDPDICQRLVVIYRELYDLQSLAVIYEKMGQFNPRYYLLALNIYMDEKDYKDAKRIILKHSLDREYLMFLYAQMHKYKKAAQIAYDLYKKEKNDKFLLKYCQYLYKSRPNKKELSQIVKYLKLLSDKYESAYIDNFLGYVLINYDINPKEGMYYVKKALSLIPNNPEYLDSLAWGYYKLRECEKAWKIVNKIKTLDDIIEFHKKHIKRCLNDIGKNHKPNEKRFGKKKK